MRLLTIGIGIRGAKIAEMLAKKGTKVNKVPLFKSYVVLNDSNALKKISLPEEKKMFVLKDVSGVINRLANIQEITEGNLIIFSLEDDFGYSTALEICEKVKDIGEDHVITLVLVPALDDLSLNEVKRKVRDIRSKSEVTFLFRGDQKTDDFILKTFNLLALAGEIDLKKKIAGEVVIDTSDVFNALRSDGFSVIGYAEKRMPFLNSLKTSAEMKAVRTKRMLELVDEAMNNLSIEGDIKDSSSALILYSASPQEITMEGLFAAISKIESLNEKIVLRYGDYPVPGSRKVSLVLLFSGVRKLRIS